MNAVVEMERWLPVAGYEGLYSVSDMGRVRAEARLVRRSNGANYLTGPRVMKAYVGAKGGYPCIRLTDGQGQAKTHYVHRLVIEAFVGPRTPEMEVCHCDGVRINNRASNLRWDNRKGNHADKNLHGTNTAGERHPQAKLNNQSVRAIRARRASGASITDLSREFKISRMTAYRAATGKSWSHII